MNILDRKNFTGNLQGIFQDVITWLLSKLNTEFIITGTGMDERPESPVDALREALVNALVHRDYRSNANVQVHVYRNRVEIISPGGLLAGAAEVVGFRGKVVFDAGKPDGTPRKLLDVSRLRQLGWEASTSR